MLELGTGPVSFGVDFADAPGNPPWSDVLDGIAAAGYRWTELGPLDYLPDDAADQLAARGLGLTGGFVFEPMHGRPSVAARRAAARIAELGGTFLVIIDAVTPARSLDRATVRGAVREIAAIAAGHGLRPVVHPHAGTHIAGEADVEPLLDDVELCRDTGQWLFAGADPVRAFERWRERIPYLHLKDLARDRVAPGFWDSVRAGAFRPLGAGDLDVAAFLRAARGFDGWAIVEQDRTPGGDPVADLVASRRLVEGLCA